MLGGGGGNWWHFGVRNHSSSPPPPFELVIYLYSFLSNGRFQITKHFRKPRDTVYVFFPVLLFISAPLYISFVLPDFRTGLSPESRESIPYTLTPCSCTLIFNIIFQSTPGFPKWTLILRFFHLTVVVYYCLRLLGGRVLRELLEHRIEGLWEVAVTPRKWFGRAYSMRWGNGNACEFQVRKAVGIHLLKKKIEVSVGWWY